MEPITCLPSLPIPPPKDRKLLHLTFLCPIFVEFSVSIIHFHLFPRTQSISELDQKLCQSSEMFFFFFYPSGGKELFCVNHTFSDENLTLNIPSTNVCYLHVTSFEARPWGDKKIAEQ